MQNLKKYLNQVYANVKILKQDQKVYDIKPIDRLSRFFYAVLFFVGSSQTKSFSADSPLMEIQSQELLGTLNWSRIPHLHNKFCSRSVTTDVLWNLDDKMLEDCGLNSVEKLQYTKAKERHVRANQSKLYEMQSNNHHF